MSTSFATSGYGFYSSTGAAFISDKEVGTAALSSNSLPTLLAALFLANLSFDSSFFFYNKDK